MDWKGKLAAFSVVGLFLLNNQDLVRPAIGLPLLVIAIAAAWRFTSGFWRIAGAGLFGGLIAGLLILGPGFRLAMRVVALMDPAKTPEFTLEGTAFIVVGIGGILGAMFGIVGNLIRRAGDIKSLMGAGLVLAGLEMTLLLTEPGLREEFLEFGAGGWFNIPLFGVFTVGYGITAMAVAELAERRFAKRPVIESEKVPA